MEQLSINKILKLIVLMFLSQETTNRQKIFFGNLERTFI
jgi:hypothetical protein